MTTRPCFIRFALSRSILALAALAPASLAKAASAAVDTVERVVATEPSVIFSAGDAPGGLSVHLPGLFVTEKGTVLAVCQLRKGSSGDWGHEIDLLVRRSEDSGLTWSPARVAFADPGTNAVNGGIVEDRESKTLVLPFTSVPIAVDTQPGWIQYFAERGGSVWVMTSADEGRTWSAPVETKPSGHDGWIAWAGNNCHGVQLPGGRLVIPGFAHRCRKGEAFHKFDLTGCLLLSDDHGRTWRIGAIGPFYGSDELAVALCKDGSLLASLRINSRTPHDLVRLLARSTDGGESFAKTWLQDNLSLNSCNVGMVQFVDKSQGTERYILAHTGPQGGHAQSAHRHFDRARLTIRLSYDGGQSWPVSRLLVADPKNTEYSDVGVAPDGTILCLYGVNTFETTGSHIELLRFPIGSIEDDAPLVGN